MTLAPADRSVLEGWWQECLAGSGTLPRGVVPVQTRLVRSVGTARLPVAGPVFLKLMSFPRAKDKLRYVHRKLPSVHEAGLLGRVAALGIVAPEPLAALGARRLGLPFRSLLVTRALEPHGRPSFAQMAAVAGELAAVGILHPDLNASNFLSLADGRVAVLDLQSAREQKGPLGDDARRRVAAKLLVGAADREQALEALVGARLVAAADRARVERMAMALEAAELTKRIERCLHESSEFTRELGVRGVLHRRRACSPGPHGVWVDRREAMRLWIGDRAGEVLRGNPPLLGALLRKSWWLLARCRLYIPDPGGHAHLTDRANSLLESYALYCEMKRRSRGQLTLTRNSGTEPAD